MHRFAQMAMLSALCLPVWSADENKPAATPAGATATAPDVNADEIIRKFAAKEKEFRRVLFRSLIFPNGVARVVQLQNFGGLPVDVVLERLGELLLLGGELANDLIRVDIGRSRSGDRRSCRGFVLVGGPDRQTQRRKHCHLGESMHFSPL